MPRDTLSGARTRSVSKDLQALDENIGAEDNAGLGAQILSFIIILLLIAASGFWFLDRQNHTKIISIYSAGITETPETSDKNWISSATEQAILAYLEVSQQLHIVKPAGKFSDLLTPKDAAWIVSGKISTVSKDSDAVYLNLSLVSTTNNHSKFFSRLSGSQSYLNDLSSRASAQINLWLNSPALSSNQISTAKAELPESKKARKNYGKGLSALDRFQSRLAIKHFELALKDGDHPLIFKELAIAWQRLGFQKRARLAAKKAFDNRFDLSRQKQLEIEAYYRIANDEWSRAIEVYRALKEFHPTDLSYRLLLIEVQLKASEMEAAFQNIQEIRKSISGFDNDPRIDLLEADYWNQAGNWEQAVKFSGNAIKKARQLGDDAILATALLSYANSEGEGDYDYLLEALSLFIKLKNPAKQSATLNQLGKKERWAGRLDSSEKYYHEAIRVASDVGDEPHIASAKASLAITLDIKGELSKGLLIKQQLKGYYSARSIKSRESIMLENIAISQFKLGNLKDSENSFTQALTIFEKINDSIGVAWSPYHLSRITIMRGDLETASQLVTGAIQNSVDNPEGDLKINAQYEAGQILFHRGEYTEAGELFSELELAFKKSGNNLGLAESSHMLARIALRLNNQLDAETKVNEAMAIYQESSAAYYILDAYVTMTDIAYKFSTDNYLEKCSLLLQDLNKTEYEFIRLRALLRSSRCNGSIENIASIENIIKQKNLFELMLDAGRIKAQMLEKKGELKKAALIKQENYQLASSKGWADY